mgnify:CR=1 FL=1
MYQFFVRDDAVKGGRVMISGSDAFHLVNVVRVKKGEKIRISTDSEANYLCAYEGQEQGNAILTIIDENICNTELKNRIHLFQGIPKKERFEYLIEKTVELGVHEIIPVRMKYCVAKLEREKADAKVARLNGKAMAAAKQSKRSHVPNVTEAKDFTEAVKRSRDMDLVIVPYENAATPPMELLREYSEMRNKDIAVFIGPEGGFAEEEIETLQGFSRIISLGDRILRTDTAAIVTLGILSVME